MKALALLTSVMAFATLVGLQDQPIVREDREISTGERFERWILQWRTQPVPACGPQKGSGWFACTCQGFAFGEQGLLDLVRRQTGRPDEVLPLAPFFANEENPATAQLSNEAVLRRWPVAASDKIDNEAAFEPTVRTRAITKVMEFGDYDHDGRATEFVLPVGATACGHDTAVAIGISRSQSSLHAFTSIGHPERPLLLGTKIWDALLHSQGAVTATEYRCGDHGAEEETEVHLSATNSGIDVTRLTYNCTSNARRGTLTSTAKF